MRSCFGHTFVSADRFFDAGTFDAEGFRDRSKRAQHLIDHFFPRSLHGTPAA